MFPHLIFSEIKGVSAKININSVWELMNMDKLNVMYLGRLKRYYFPYLTMDGERGPKYEAFLFL